MEEISERSGWAEIPLYCFVLFHDFNLEFDYFASCILFEYYFFLFF